MLNSTNWRQMKEGGAWWQLMCMTDALQDLDSGKYSTSPFVWVWSKTENHILVWLVNSVSLEPYLHAWAALTESNHRERIGLWHQLVCFIVERVPAASIGVCFQQSWRVCMRDRSTVCLSGGETQGPVSGGVCRAPWAQIWSSLSAWAKFCLQEKFSLLYPYGKICRKTIISKKKERCFLIFTWSSYFSKSVIE